MHSPTTIPCDEKEKLESDLSLVARKPSSPPPKSLPLSQSRFSSPSQSNRNHNETPMLVLKPRLRLSREGLIESREELPSPTTKPFRANCRAIATNHDSPKTRNLQAMRTTHDTLHNSDDSTDYSDDSETEQKEEIPTHSSPGDTNDRMTHRSSFNCSDGDLPCGYQPMKNEKTQMTTKTREVKLSIRISHNETQKIRTEEKASTDWKHITQNNTATSVCSPTTGSRSKPSVAVVRGLDDTSHEVANSSTTESSPSSAKLAYFVETTTACHRDGPPASNKMNAAGKEGKSPSSPSLHPPAIEVKQLKPSSQSKVEPLPPPPSSNTSTTSTENSETQLSLAVLKPKGLVYTSAPLLKTETDSSLTSLTSLEKESTVELFKPKSNKTNAIGVKKLPSAIMCPSAPPLAKSGSSSTSASAFLQKKKAITQTRVGNKRKRSGSTGSSSTSKSSSQQAKQKGQSSGRWTQAEHQAFLEGLTECGREWKKVALRIPTRTSAQIRSHAQKYFAKLQRDQESSAAAAASSSYYPSGDATPILSSSSNLVVLADSGHLSGTIVTGSAIAPSVRRNLERILSNPRAAQREVEDTMEALRERYRQLQQRLEERRKERDTRRKQRKQHLKASTSEVSSSSSPLAPESQSRFMRSLSLHSNSKKSNDSTSNSKTRAVPARHLPSPASGDENSSVSSNVSSIAASRTDLGNEEIIALEVLGGSLPRGDSVNDLPMLGQEVCASGRGDYTGADDDLNATHHSSSTYDLLVAPPMSGVSNDHDNHSERHSLQAKATSNASEVKLPHK